MIDLSPSTSNRGTLYMLNKNMLVVPGQGTRSHMHAATKSSHAATKELACRN